jgi:hypothetical protein
MNRPTRDYAFLRRTIEAYAGRRCGSGASTMAANAGPDLERQRGTSMKWLWIGFALVWAVSIVLDSRRRDRVSRNVTRNESAEREPATRARDAELPAVRDAELPALLLPRSSP